MRNKALYIHITIVSLYESQFSFGGCNWFLVFWGIIHLFSFENCQMLPLEIYSKIFIMDFLLQLQNRQVYYLTFFQCISFVAGMYSYSEQVCKTGDDHVMVMQNAVENF